MVAMVAMACRSIRAMSRYSGRPSPPTLNQWPPHAQQARCAFVSPQSSSSRSNSATPSSRPGNSHGDALGLLNLLPSQHDNNDNNLSPVFDLGYDFGAFDFNTSPDLFLAGDGLDGHQDNWFAQGCLLDPTLDLSGGAVLIPDMATQTQTSPPLGMSGDFLHLDGDFLSQETANLITSTLEQPSSSISHLHASNPTTTTSSPSKNSPSYAVTSSGFSTFSLNPNSQHSPDSNSSLTSSTKRKAESPPEDDPAAVVLKRQRNTVAARKYRQKRLDRIAELEEALAEMTGDRDDLRLKLARREAEVDALREVLGRSEKSHTPRHTSTVTPHNT
ncbi:hypothetical protein G7Z17_g8783 [Cylindrodendrum hubeiense]|uniref:BZIP domain-containing protein n=1 Tax=Cylindrodendrum hubeiense TaxID=595255 RepID=A0A9P5H4K5_9HYPO|nr:hypothetical protein G7Z17_g8783 [Cylindrodendrum hubeiense]